MGAGAAGPGKSKTPVTAKAHLPFTNILGHASPASAAKKVGELLLVLLLAALVFAGVGVYAVWRLRKRRVRKVIREYRQRVEGFTA